MTPSGPVRTAPYVAFKSFCSAIQSLRAHGLPSTLNRTAWESRSGAEQSQILGALTFLGLINDKGETQSSLRELASITENSDTERQFWSKLLRDRYEKVFLLDLTNETPKAIEDAIGEYGVSGKVRDRAVRFFLKAALYAKVALSSRLTAKMRDMPTEAAEPEADNEAGSVKASSGAKPARRKRRTGQSNGSSNQPPPPPPPPPQGNAMKTIELPVVKGTLSITGTFNAFELVGEERELVYKIIDLMAGYGSKNKA